MKKLLVIIAVIFLTIPVSAQNFGYAAWEQRQPWAGFVGLYFPSTELSGWDVQIQFINQPQVWLVGGPYLVLGDWFLELNTGPVLYREDMRVSNWSFQPNLSLGNSRSQWNVFLGNEYDVPLDDYDEIVFIIHNILHRISDGLYVGINYEYLKFGTDQYLMVGPMIRYYVTDKFKMSLAPRAKTSGTENLDLSKFQWNNLYVNVTYEFEF